MYIGRRVCFRVVSCILAFSFLITGPSNANITDALKPPKSDSNDILQLGDDVARAPQFSITDPEKIIIAENMGRVREIFKGNNGKLIINIQDAHCNFEAQTNICQILDVLVSHGLRIVALEGSSGEIDPSIFTTYPDEEIRKEVAAYFLKKGKINGAEYLAITSKNPPQLYGVETKEYYLANLATFLNTLNERDKIKAACSSVKSTLEKLKERVYSKELRAMDERAITNANDEAKLADYCWFLKQMAESKKVPIDRFPDLVLLYKTVEIEKAIDFDRVADERANAISALENNLTQSELEELFSKSVGFKSGRITATMYHVYLRRMALAKGADYAKYPNLNLYTDYLLIYDKINTSNLFKELVELENDIKEKLFTNQDQRDLDRLSKNIRLLENMFDISMSKEDVDYYQKNRKDFTSAAFTDFVSRQAKRYKVPAEYSADFALVDKYLPDMENFYRIAETRDDAILENTLKKMDEENAQVVALITGGYHTQGIAERLRDRGISYVVITPRITRAEKDSPYLEILSSEKLPDRVGLKKDSANLAVNSGLEKNGGPAGTDEAEFAIAVHEAFRHAEENRRAETLIATATTFEPSAVVSGPTRLELAQQVTFNDPIPSPGMVFDMDAIESDTRDMPPAITVTGFSFIGNKDNAGNRDMVISIARPFDLPADVLDVASNLVEWHTDGIAVDDPARELKLHALRIFEGYLGIPPQELLKQLQSGRSAPDYCIAALMQQGFVATCAHRGDVKSKKPYPTIPVNIDELEKAVGHMISHRLDITLNAVNAKDRKRVAKPTPIYLIPEGEMREWTSEGTRFMRVTFRVSEGLSAGRPMMFEVQVPATGPAVVYRIEGPIDNETAVPVTMSTHNISRVREVMEGYFSAKREHAQANAAQVQAAAVRSLKKTAAENVKFELEGLRRKLELGTGVEADIRGEIVACEERKRTADQEAGAAENAYKAANETLRAALSRVEGAKARGFPNLHKLMIDRGEYRENMLAAYLGGTRAIAFSSGMFWNLKRAENLLAILRDPSLQKRLRTLAVKLQGFAKMEEKTLNNADASIFSSQNTDIIGQALVSLSDMEWAIQEALKAVDGIEDLSGRRRQDLINDVPGISGVLGIQGMPLRAPAAFTLPQPVFRQLAYANTILERMDAVMDSIDYQMETRGRDSLGFAGTFTFKNRAAYEEFLRLLESTQRLGSDTRGLTAGERNRLAALITQLNERLAVAGNKNERKRIEAQIEELQKILSGKQRLEAIMERLTAEHELAVGQEKSDIAHRIERLHNIITGGTLKDELLFRAQGIRDMTNLSIRLSEPTQDPDAPVSVTFIYKTAERVGRLGDNVARIREDIKSDRLLRILLGLDDEINAFTLVSHTRWASCGTISEPNCHPVDSEGVYQYAERAAAERQIYKFTHPRYPGNDITIAVLNGDITNYTELRQRYEETGGAFRRHISPQITTDTKVIPLVIESYLAQGYSLEEAVWLAGREFEGSFAIQVSSHLEPGKMYLLQAGEGQELNIGISRDGFHPASEVYGFVRETQQYVKLKPEPGEGILAVIDDNLEPWVENIRYSKFTRSHKAMPTVEANRALQDLQAAVQAPFRRAARLRQDAEIMAKLLTENIGVIPERLRPEILLATAATIQQASMLSAPQDLDPLRDTIRGLIQGVYGTYTAASTGQLTLDQALSLLNNHPIDLSLEAFSDSLGATVDQLIAARAQMVTSDFATNLYHLAAYASVISTLGSMRGALNEAAQAPLGDTISDIREKLISYTNQLCACGLVGTLSPELARAGVRYLYAARGCLISLAGPNYAAANPEEQLINAGLEQYLPERGAPAQSISEAVNEMAKHTMVAKHFTKKDMDPPTPLTSRDTYLPKGFTHYLFKELNQGPKMLQDTCRGKIGIRTENRREIPEINVDASTLPPAFIEQILSGQRKRVIFAGMGTADTAAGASAEILRSQLTALNDILRENGMPPVIIETFSELATNASAFDIREDMSDTLIVAISQSGGTTDTNAYLSQASAERAAGRGALLLGIINKRDSDMDKAIRNVRDQYGNPAGGVIYTGTGRDVEIAVASTKAFYAQIAAASIICMKIMRELAKKYDQQQPGRHILERFDALLVEDIKELQALPAKMRSLLDAIKDTPDHIVRIAARTAALECIEWAIEGGGTGYFAAKEGRIKLGELCFKSFQELFFSGDAVPPRMLNKTWVVVNGAGVHGRHMRFVNRTPEQTLKMLEAGATVTFVTEEGDTRYDDPRFAVYRNGLVNLTSFKGAELQPLLDTLRRTGFRTLRFDMTAAASTENLVHALHSQLENRLDEEEARNIVSGLVAWRRLTGSDLAATCERIRGIAGYNDLDFDPAASGATGLRLIEALCAQKGISLTGAQRLVYDSHPARLHVVKVPKCTERFATILNTVVDHALGYYGAVAINERAVHLGQGQFGNVIRNMLGGQFNTGFPPEFSTRFALLHMAAEGRLKVEDLNRILGTRYRSHPEVVRAFQDFVQKCRDHSARGIDAVLHQAKFVTVGATRQGFELRIGSVIDKAIKPQSDHALFHGADRLVLRSLYMLYSQDLKTQVQIVPVAEGKARVFVVCQNRAGITDDIEAAMRQAGCAVTGRDKLEFDIPSSEAIMQVFDIPVSAEQARSHGLEDAIVRGLAGRRLEALSAEDIQYHGPKETIPLAVETVAESTISASMSFALPGGGQLLKPEIKLSNAQFPPSVREQIASGRIRRIIFVGDGVARSVGEAAKNTMEGYIRDIHNLLVKESVERAEPLAKYDIHVEVSSMTAVQLETFGVTEDMSDALVIGIAGDRQMPELLTCMDSARGHGAQLLAITQDGNTGHDPLRAFISVRKSGSIDVRDSGEGLHAPLVALSVYSMEFARLLTESICASARQDSGMELRLAGRMEAVILDDVVELRHAMPNKLRRFLAAAQKKATPVAKAVDQAAQFWPHRKMDWKLLGDGPGYAVGQFGRELIARRCGKATEGDFVENYKHKDTSTESFVILLTANIRGTGDNYNLDILSELEKWRAHESFVVIVCTEGDRRFDNFGIPLISATGEVVERMSPFPVIPVPQTSERFSGFLLGLAADTVTENVAELMEGRVDQLRAAKRALFAIADPEEATPEKLGERAFVQTLTTRCSPIMTDMSKGMYNAYLPTNLAARFTGLYVLLNRVVTIEDAAEYTGRDYANTGGMLAAYRDFCALIDQMIDMMSMRAVVPVPTVPPAPPIDTEADARQETKSRIQTAPVRPTSEIPGNEAMSSDAAKAITSRRIAELRDRGVTIEGDENSIVIEKDVYVETGATIKKGARLTGSTKVCKGAVVAGDVHASSVGERALVGTGGEVFDSVLEEGVECFGTVHSSLIHKNASISMFARVVTEPGREEEWELAPQREEDDRPNLNKHIVKSQRSEIGEDAVIEGIVENARIGKNSKLLACRDTQGRFWRPYISDGSIGENNRVIGPVRIWLANLADDHLIGNFETVIKEGTGEKTTVATGPLEITDFSEDPVYSGMPFGQAGRGPEYYVEYVEGFPLPLTTMSPAGEYKYWDTPGRFIQGRGAMEMEFSGGLKPQAETIKAITGKETSGHGILAMFPFAVIGANAKLIGAPDYWNRDNLRTPGDVMDRYDRTFMGSFSVLWPGCEGWGRIGAFSRRRGLSILDEDIGWVLQNAPGVIIDQLMALPETERGKLDGVVEALILTEIRQLEKQISRLEEKAGTLRSLPNYPENLNKLERTEAYLNRIKEGIRFLRQQYDSGAWKFEGGRFTAPWVPAEDGTYSCEGWTGPVSGERQYTLLELLQETPERKRPARVMRTPFSAEQLGAIEARVQDGRIIVEEGADVHPKAVLLPGTIVRKGARVEEGAFLRGVDVPSGAVVHRNAEVSLCVIEGPRHIGEGARVSMMRINADIGNAVAGVMTYNDSVVDNKSILRPYSGVGEESHIGPNCTVGSLVDHANWTGGNIRNEHLATDIDYENIPPLAIEITDGAGAIHKATLCPPVTHGAGTLIQGTADAPVTAVSAFFAGMGVIKKGASLMAAFTKFGLNEGERLSPFTRSDGPGAESKSIAGLLEDSMLFYIMRHEMSYTMKVTPRQDKWAVGYMIESLILRGLQDDILPHLGTSPLSDEVRKLIELVREDFKDMSINPTAAGLRAQINNTIARIKTFISQQETTATDEQKRLLKGIKRYATGLDGRFRARYDSQQDEIVFTEGEMRYYKESGVNESRYYMDAGDYEWIPNEKIAARERRTDAIAAAAI